MVIEREPEGHSNVLRERNPEVRIKPSRGWQKFLALSQVPGECKLPRCQRKVLTAGLKQSK